MILPPGVVINRAKFGFFVLHKCTTIASQLNQFLCTLDAILGTGFVAKAAVKLIREEFRTELMSDFCKV